MKEVLVLSPSFGQWSRRPFERMAELGLTARSPRARSPLTSDQLQAEVGDAVALIVGLDQVDAAAIAAGRQLRVIAKHGVGVDNIDVSAATARGIAVVNVPAGNSSAVADLVLGLILALARDIVNAHLSVVEGRWDKFHGPELAGKQLGIVGFGRIGQEVAQRALGFGMHVVAYDPYKEPAEFASAHVERSNDLGDLLAASDVVTLHLPSMGRPVVDEAVLRTMKPQALLVNAARGDLVDEDAVAEALKAGCLGGYAADAFRHEPPTDSPLLHAPRTVFTPHVGAFTDRANELMGVSVIEGIAAVLSGEQPAHPVNPPTQKEE